MAFRCEPVRLCRGRAVACKSYLRTKTRPEPVVPVPVVIVVVMDAAITPANDAMHPVETEARCMREGADWGDMTRPYGDCCTAVNRFICNFSFSVER